MKKNLLRVTLVSCLLITSLLFGGAAYAQDEGLPDPGITPDSPFYFFDTWGKNISMFFTFGPEAKAKKALRYAEERLSEAQAMGNKNKVREMAQAANDYDNFMAMVNERLEEAAKNGTSDNISERLAALSYRIHVRLSELKDKMPPGGKKDITSADNETREEAQETINRAKIATINSQIKALRILAKNKPERALDISSDTIEKLMERARFRVSENVTTDNVTGDVEETLDYADRIAALEEEIATLAEEMGIDITKIQERLAHSTANRLETLTGVYEKAPEAARKGIENAIENSVRKYERTVEKLREINVTDNVTDVTENMTALQKLPERVKEKLNIKISNKERIADDTSDNITIKVRIEKEKQEQTKEQPAASANKTSSPQAG